MPNSNLNHKAGGVKTYVVLIGEKVSQSFLNSAVIYPRSNRYKDFQVWGGF